MRALDWSPDKVSADEEGLGKAVGAGLHGVTKLDSPLASVAEQVGKAGGVLGRGDEQNLAQAGQHEGAERVIDHRLVVDRAEAASTPRG